ncbi:unnamed protein product [marine sediment metagenome]|uniref:Uncharacterized protein n=1 Tax=marine sediment metagenome TaxID=412755 RepID=X0TLL8_9ZZZZ
MCEIKNKTKYFFFISDTPNELDFINFNVNGLYYRLIKKQKMKDNHIYFQDPLKRIKQFHTSFIDYATGDIFNSPFK